MHTAGAWDQVLRFMSPLVIEDELLERGLDAFEDSLETLDGSPEAAAARAGPQPRTATAWRSPGGPALGHPVPPANPGPHPISGTEDESD